MGTPAHFQPLVTRVRHETPMGLSAMAQALTAIRQMENELLLPRERMALAQDFPQRILAVADKVERIEILAVVMRRISFWSTRVEAKFKAEIWDHADLSVLASLTMAREAIERLG